MKDLPTDSVYGKEEVTSAAIQLMLILSKSALTEANVSNSSLQSAINFITQHIYEELTIDVISEACYMNKYHLCRTFKKKLGCTVMEYVLQTRLAMAKELLEKSDSSITNVSVLSGFSSPAYFSRVFSEHVGLSPSAYKKKYRS